MQQPACHSRARLFSDNALYSLTQCIIRWSRTITEHQLVQIIEKILDKSLKVFYRLYILSESPQGPIILSSISQLPETLWSISSLAAKIVQELRRQKERERAIWLAANSLESVVDTLALLPSYHTNAQNMVRWLSDDIRNVIKLLNYSIPSLKTTSA